MLAQYRFLGGESGSRKVCFCDLKISMAVIIPAREVVLPSLLRLTEEMQHKARKIYVEIL